MVRTALALGLVVAVAAPAAAQPRRKHKVGDVQGATLRHEVKPSQGFVDDAIAFDGAGGRLVYVRSDAGSLSELGVLDIAQGYAGLATIDISSITTIPTEVHFALDGQHYLVIYRTGPADDAPEAAALVSASGKKVRSFGPATDVAFVTYGREPAVVMYDQKTTRDNKGRVRVDHTVEARNLATGKRLGKKTTLSADDTGRVGKLDFRLQYWRNGYTQAVGIKGGTWDRKEDQRSPDQAAVYDLPQRTFSRISPIADVRSHALATQVYAEHANEDSFLRVTNDLTGLRWWRAGAAPADVAVEQPFHHYDPRSLRYERTADGGMWFSLTIDPVNPDAVARKKADDRWLDLYRLDPGAARARRVARLLVGKRPVDWTASAEHWVVLEKHLGFSRGGKTLAIYATR